MQHHGYSYGEEGYSTSRHSVSHGTSSAFSANANPNEDWTKISDLAERRRIQNRIAQRNYRKKLKARLEDLERKAGSGSVSPQPESRRSSSETSHEGRSRGLSMSDHATRSSYGRHLSPEMMTSLEYSGSSGDERYDLYDRQYNKSPPLFAYSSVASSDQALYAPYPQHTPLQSMPLGMLGEYSTSSPYSTTTSAGLSTSSHGSSQPSMYADEDLLNPFSISYSSMASADVALPQFQEYSTNSPTLSMRSHRHSSSVSPSDTSSIYPITPMSGAESPRFRIR